MAYKIVLLDPISPARGERMRTLLPPGFVFDHGREPGEAAMQDLVRDADFAISGQVAVPGTVMRAATRLKVLHKWGVGVDNFDLETARALGIVVARTTGSNALPVAELTLALMLSALRFVPHADRAMRAGHWRDPAGMPGETFLLSGKTVGLVGFGHIGKTVARLLVGFGCPILYARRTPTPPGEETHGALAAPIGELIERSDVVSLHCPLTPETANLIDGAALARMKRTAVLINVARGGVVVEADLARALRRRTISAAAMDVFAVEPLPPESELRGLDNLILTPHMAAGTSDTFEKNVRWMFDNFARAARGEPIPERDRVP